MAVDGGRGVSYAKTDAGRRLVPDLAPMFAGYSIPKFIQEADMLVDVEGLKGAIHEALGWTPHEIIFKADGSFQFFQYGLHTPSVPPFIPQWAAKLKAWDKDLLA